MMIVRDWTYNDTEGTGFPPGACGIPVAVSRGQIF